MKKILLKLLLPMCILFLGIGIFIYLAATKPSSQTASIQERVWQVQTQHVELADLSPALTLYGTVETAALVNAAAPGKSRVLSIAVNEGDAIRTGQLLLTLDPRDYQPKVNREQAKVTELQALIKSEKLHHQADKKAYQHEQSLLNLEKSAVKRARQLKNKNMGSAANLELAQEELEKQQLAFTERKMNLDDHQARMQQLQARLDYAQAELELALLDFERSQIVAPFAGYVEKLQVSAGDQVTDNQVLLSFYPYHALEVRAKIPAPFQYEIQTALSQGEALIATTQIGTQAITLQLDRLAGAADTRGIDALFNINSENPLLRLGSSISLILQRPAQANTVVIPFSALYDSNRIYTFEKGRLQALKVNYIGEYKAADGTMKLLISSAQLSAEDRIVITQLPNAVSGLAVSEANSISSNN